MCHPTPHRGRERLLVRYLHAAARARKVWPIAALSSARPNHHAVPNYNALANYLGMKVGGIAALLHNQQ